MNPTVDMELLASYLRTNQVLNCLRWANMAGYLYHYVTTLEDEVRYIWSRKFTFGKALYMVTRYSPIVLDSFTIAGVYTSAVHGSGKSNVVCNAMAIVQSVTSFIVSASADAAMVLCLYALMGARRRYMVLFVLVYLAFMIPALVLNCLSQIRLGIPVVQDAVLEELGFVCEVQQSRGVSYSTAVLSLYLSETVVFMIIGIIVLVMRYRCQNNSLICSIRRDGGAFYGTAFLVRIMYTIFVIMWEKRPGYALHDKIMGSIFENLDTFLTPVLATTLIINLRKIDNPSSKAVISALVFAVEKDLAFPADNGHTAIV